MSKQNTAAKVANLAQELKANVNKLREGIDSLQGERDAIQQSLLPPHEAAERAQQMVDTLAATFSKDAAYKLSGCLRADGVPSQSGLFSFDIFTHAAIDNTTTINTGGMLCFLFGDTIKEKLASHIESMSYDYGPPAAERPELIRELDSEILLLEREEERLISEAESCGFEIVRRADCNPEVVLEVSP